MDQFKFRKLDDGNYSLIKIKASSNNLTIPSRYNNGLVLEISESAFDGRNNVVENIVIPSTVNEITILEFSFEGWNKLKSIIVEDGNSSYKSIDGVLFNKEGDCLLKYPQNKENECYEVPSTVKKISYEAFAHAVSLKNVILNDNLEVIEEAAFAECHSLKEINFPESLLKIKESAFVNCSSLEKVILPSKLRSGLDDSVFQGCKNLSSIEISDGNKKYATVDGILYDKKITKLITYPSNKEGEEFTIPETVTTLYKGCFGGNHYLKQINIPSSLKTIESLVFDDVKSLENIEVDSLNENFSSKDGIIYSKDLTKLIYFPIGKKITEFSVPEGVICLGESSFASCQYIQKLILPKSLTCIDSFAISKMPNLKEIQFNGSIDDIDISIGNFDTCQQLNTSLKTSTLMFEDDDDIFEESD